MKRETSREIKQDIRPGEPIGYPPENPPKENPLLTPEQKREDQYEKTISDPEATTPFHQNVYVQTILGALLFLGMIFFYVTHISGSGSLGKYGQRSDPPVMTDH